MAKQTFTTGQVLTAAQMTSLQQTAMSGGAASAKTASYTLVAADAGTAISMSNASATTITVNTALFAAGDTVHITNLGAGVCTITAGTATVNSSASLALAQYESGFLDFTSTSAAIFVKGAGAAGSSAGKVLQVVQAVTSTGVSVAGTTFADTGVTGTITPSAASSKILVMVSQTFLGLASAADEAISLKMLRGATEIFQNGGTGHYISGYVKATGATATGIGGTNSMIYLDSPSTTSATTYKIQGRNEKSGGTAYFQEQSASSTITLMEIGA